MLWIKEFQGRKGHVILVHGLGEHSKRYLWLSELLQKEDYGLILFDLPGHGESSGKRGHATFEEIFDFLDRLLESHPNSFLMGHSLGGLIAVRYAELRENLRGLVVTSPALRLSKDNSLLRFVASFFSLVAPRLTFDNGIDPNNLSTNKDAVKRYVKDPLVHKKISAKLAHDMFVNSRVALKEANKISVPCLVALGEKDSITFPEGGKQLFDLISSPDKTLKVYKGSFHELFEDEKNGPIFMKDLIDWIKKH